MSRFPHVTEAEWRAEMLAQLKSPKKDVPPPAGWLRSWEIADLMGCARSVAYRHIPKTWESKMFPRLVRDGRVFPVIHYRPPFPISQSGNGKSSSKASDPCIRTSRKPHGTG
jgi:predicted DNA-binding transcriptional regulator AlpA